MTHERSRPWQIAACAHRDTSTHIASYTRECVSTHLMLNTHTQVFRSRKLREAANEALSNSTLHGNSVVRDGSSAGLLSSLCCVPRALDAPPDGGNSAFVFSGSLTNVCLENGAGSFKLGPNAGVWLTCVQIKILYWIIYFFWLGSFGRTLTAGTVHQDNSNLLSGFWPCLYAVYLLSQLYPSCCLKLASVLTRRAAEAFLFWEIDGIFNSIHLALEHNSRIVCSEKTGRRQQENTSIHTSMRAHPQLVSAVVTEAK